jgi:hypothetical protein
MLRAGRDLEDGVIAVLVIVVLFVLIATVSLNRDSTRLRP